MGGLVWPDISFGPCNLYSFVPLWKLERASLEFRDDLAEAPQYTSPGDLAQTDSPHDTSCISRIQIDSMLIALADYPALRQIFWSTPDLDRVDDYTAWSAYDNNWRWVDTGALSADEWALIKRLALAFGNGHIGDWHVPS